MSDAQAPVDADGSTDWVWGCRVLAGPTLAAYGVCRWYQGLSGVRGPGVTWSVGHALLWCSQFALIVVLVADAPLCRRGHLLRWRQAVVGVVAASSLLGGLASLAQTTLDLVVGIMASDRAGMERLYARTSAHWWTSFVTNHAVVALLPVSTLLWALNTPHVHGLVRRAVCGVVAVGFVVSLTHPNLLPVSGCLLTGLLISAVPVTREKSPAGA